MKNLILIIVIFFNGAIFGQDTLSLPAPAETENPVTGTICHFPRNETASFPGGTEVFIKKLENAITLDSGKTKRGKNILRAILNFMVEKDGSITQIQATGSNKSFNIAVEKAVRRIKGKWIPARYDGNLVISKIQIPVSISLNNFE